MEEIRLSQLPPVYGKTVDPDTGLLRDCPQVMVNAEPLFLDEGACLFWKDPRWEYQLYFYSPQVRDELIHTYTYQPEAVWASYSPARSSLEWSREDRAVAAGYYRIAVRAREGEALPARWKEAVEVSQTLREPDRSWLDAEVESTLQRALAQKARSGVTLFLLTDTHYAVGCNWLDTQYSLGAVARRLAPDAVVHLGDLTDGLTPLEQTLRYAGRVQAGLQALGAPVYLCLGNHDANYFRGNRDFLTTGECARRYLGREKPWYAVDFPAHQLRLFFLDSFSPTRKERYGFSAAERRWFARTLRKTPPGFRVLVFSHVTPDPVIHVWSRRILRGEKMMRTLEKWGDRRQRKVLGWICGHNHADQIVRTHSFPIIAVGCSKLEDFPEHKPAGSLTYHRAPHTADQELWDVLLIADETDRLDFIRFGAGEDRSVVAAGQGARHD